MDAKAVRVLLCCLVVLWGAGAAVGPALAAADAVGGSDGASQASAPTGVVSTAQESGAADDGETSDDGDDEPSIDGFDEVNVAIDLRGNGSAAWTIEYRYRLDDENATADWESLSENVSDRPGEYILMFRERNAGLVSDAENATDRNMSTSNYSVETDESSSPQAYGYVRFTFEWSAFALVEVNRIEAGPALSGFTMDERTQLAVSWPEEYENVTVQPEPDDQSGNNVLWYGDETREFVEGEPYIELIATGGEPVESGEQEEEGLPLTWMVGAGALMVALVVLGAAVAVVWSRTRTDDGGGAAEAEPAQPAPAPTPDDGDEPVESASAPPPELLSNEERVLGLLEDHGGRIKQQEVVTELDWTEAKTSQVVSGLREDGEIEVFRIGRENVLAVDDGKSDTGSGAGDAATDSGGPAGDG
ncbi:helix-turn-helix transcriptional regulator [Saliphagus infecundisoli]|uniref:Helix-turn-helix transcriptional regulator n=1 Tax=Saliphagus infecundisoli TaxID=1849069 RepID=A0ABD5QBP4_9EURY|nr:hypothetical protein [Saliphagus infecundisoli]